VELARIVGRNQNREPEVANDRVGSTDYFAALDGPDILSDPEPAAPVVTPATPAPAPYGSGAEPEPAGQKVAHVREEPSFFAAADQIEQPQGGQGAAPQVHADTWQEAPPIEPVTSVVQQEVQFDGQPGLGSAPQTATPQTVQPAADPQVQARAQAEAFPHTLNPAGALPETSLHAPSAPAAAAPPRDLEQNLTADLENELMGAFQNTFEPRGQQARPVTPAFGAAPEPLGPPPVISETAAEPGPSALENELAAAMAAHAPEPAPASYVQDDIFAEEMAAAAVQEQAPAAEPEVAAARPVDEVFEQVFAQQIQPEEAPSAEPGPEMQIGANQHQPESAEVQQPLPGIDEMAWPAAADVLGAAERNPEHEDMPPPEGYDLDAVARAMQESDPTLGDAGVLPPHSSEEQELAPQSKGSRKGLVTALAVLGIGVLGAGVFAFVDFGPSAPPSGPPAVIAGLEGPLKVYPENTPQETPGGTSKLIYDRVGTGGAADSERLVVPETPEPATLPPAPANLNNESDVVPSGPKKVRTLVVRPDGTIISDNPAGAPVGNGTPAPATVETVRVQPSTPDASAPPAAAEPQTPVVTAPVQNETPAVQPQAPQTPVVQPEPAAPEVPAIVATPEPTGPVPSVLPKKKPAVPTQVARAPANSGPLNLTSPAAQPANPAPAQPAGATIARGTYIVQVSSQRSESQAQAAYDGLQRRYPAILGSRSPVIQAANVEGRGTFYRVRIPTGSRDEANRLCESLKSAGGDCFVRRY